MLISLQHRFIFVATPRGASTAIEGALRPWCEICIGQSAFGKHDGLAAIQERFAWALDLPPRRPFFVFGVMRDPVDFLLSLYRFHAHPEFARDAAAYTGAMSFGDFLDRWVPEHAWQSGPQWERFCDRDGAFGLDYLLDHDRLEAQFADVLRWLGLPEVPLARQNASPDGLRREALDPALRARVHAERAADLELLRNFSGRILRGPAAQRA